MTAPDFRRRNYGRGHAYFLGDRKLDGVTTLIGQGLPKPALVQWAANCAADLACDEWDALGELPLSERRKRLAGAPNAARDSAAVKGTRVHALADKLANGEEVQVPDDLTGHVEACVRFLDEWQVKTLFTERPVFHEKYLYAGTFDLYAEIGDESWLLDFKTNKSGPFGDVAFQLAAYGNATHFQLDTGVMPMPTPDRYGVVWLRSDGYELYPYHVDQAVFRQFLYIQQTAKAAGMSRDFKGDALTAPQRTDHA